MLACAQLCFADYVVDHALLFPWLGDTVNYRLLRGSFFLISFLAMISHARTMLTDPGAVPMGYQPNTLLANEGGSKMPMCSRCDGFKPPRAHHCSQCDRCIVKMDHHCPWVNNCVGINNQKHFVLFTRYVATLSLYAIVLLVCRGVSTAQDVKTEFNRAAVDGGKRYVHAHGHGHGHYQHSDTGGRFLMMCLLFFESLLFGLFTLAMFTEQLSSIIADQTGVCRAFIHPSAL